MREWTKRHFPAIDKFVDRIGYWFGVPLFGLVWAAMTWLFNNLTAIANYGWAAVALAAIAGTCLIALVVSAWLMAWRYFNPVQRYLSPYDSSAYSHDPAAGAPTREVYYSLIDFVVQYLWPACDRQIDLQKAVLREANADAVIVDLAIEGMQLDLRPHAQAFWIQYNNLIQGIEGSEPMIGFEAMIDCINRLENGVYKNFCDLTVETAKQLKVHDIKSYPTLGPIWEQWRTHHNRLVDEHKKVQQNPRFGRRVYRPNRVGNWGDKLPPFKDEG